MVAVAAAAGADVEAAVAVAGADSWYANGCGGRHEALQPVNGRIGHWWLTTLGALLVAGVVNCAAVVDMRAAAASQQATYKSPQEAADALVAAVKSGGIDGIVAVLGTKGRNSQVQGTTSLTPPHASGSEPPTRSATI